MPRSLSARFWPTDHFAAARHLVDALTIER